MTDDEQVTDAGRAFREQIEVRTDDLERPVLEAIGDDLDEALDYLTVWGDAITEAGLVPPNGAPASAGADRISAPGCPSTRPPTCTRHGADVHGVTSIRT